MKKCKGCNPRSAVIRRSGRTAEPMAAAKRLSQETEHGVRERMLGTSLNIHEPVFAGYALQTAAVHGLHPNEKGPARTWGAPVGQVTGAGMPCRPLPPL